LNSLKIFISDTDRVAHGASIHFYRATACNAMQSIVMAILSVFLSVCHTRVL